MLDTLLESKTKRSRSPAGAIISVTAHTALIAAALYATAQARPERSTPREVIRPLYMPPQTSPMPASSPAASRQARPAVRRLMFVEPNFAINVPPIDFSGTVSRPDDFSHTPFGAINPNLVGENVSVGPDGPFRADQVEKQVMLVPGAAPPRYPEVLRSSGVEGQVIALFVVDEQGQAEEGSLRFVRSDNRLFQDAVRVALRRMRFVPAEVGGKKVRQLVQMPFVFTIVR